MRLRNLILGRQETTTMPTTCAVIGCHNRHSAAKKTGYYRFPSAKRYPDCRRQWLAFLSRQTPDGSPWKPDKGDRVCSEHFISGRRSMEPTNPDYVPSIYPKKDSDDEDDIDSKRTLTSAAVE